MREAFTAARVHRCRALTLAACVPWLTRSAPIVTPVGCLNAGHAEPRPPSLRASPEPRLERAPGGALDGQDLEAACKDGQICAKNGCVTLPQELRTR